MRPDLRSFDPEPFQPHWLLRGGHRQTFATAFFTRECKVPVDEQLLVPVDRIGEELESRVRCDCSWQADTPQGTALIVHGLGGSSTSPIVLGIARRLWCAGWDVVRYNMRNCGESEREASTLYHSGMHGDVQQVIAELLRRGKSTIALIGFSAGGNLVLNTAAAYGERVPEQLKSVVAVSGAMDVAIAADELHNPANRFYEYIFVRELEELLRKKIRDFPHIFRAEDLRRYASVRQYDECVTAPYSGYPDASTLYAAISSSRWAEHIAVPTLVLHAADDPFIRLLPPTREKLAANPNTLLLEPEHGGHCGFIDSNFERWSEKVAMQWIAHVIGEEVCVDCAASS